MKWIALGLAMSLSFAAFGKPLTPAARLKKLSRMIRGTDPQVVEYGLLQKAVAKGEAEKYFADTTVGYLATPNHAGKMINRLEALFQLRTGAQPPEHGVRSDIGQSATEEIFKRVSSENLSWDELLVSKRYVIYSSVAATESEFFRLVFDFPMSSEDTTITGEADDPRLAGAVTTLRFANRYTNSTTNKNRRRAAAIFRIFLCDPMRPAVDVDQGEISKLFDLAFDKEQIAVQTHKVATAGIDPHGADPKCVTCHYKLDPMGRFFSGMGSSLGPAPTKGRLVYKRKDGTRVDIEGRGLGDMALAVTKQPEYVECQVSHFWKWFITSAWPLTSSVKAELVAKFDELGRKPNDFIKYLVTRKEFTEAPEENAQPVMFMSKIAPVFKRCNECHKEMDDFPDFTQLPLGGSKDLNVVWLKKISKMIDLPNNGANRVMPPANAGWDLTNDEITDIKRWIEYQAKDENGNPSVTPEEAALILRGGK
ncbi:MAG: hypothetical protein ABL958_03665 [Bdellovibrionia bacterium]